ncbi:type VI secretion system ImpA family N-terminal domain-containing protein [Variovorax ureilyticus]|uniref:Type VI secretion system ImpA family N-terminal domain-containing protein n=1 Tax=Variovorax ureilyticus TaxID=1836198 RepID=A0ABU8VCG3_9BURK
MPISDEAPCGASLEYDAEYAVLLSRMTPRGEAQYGDFVGTAEAPSWAEIERDCRRLLLRTKDIHLLVWLCRARTRLAQAAGLAQSLSMLATVLQTWPDAVHPQLVIEGQFEPEVRANALAGLADPEGLLGDVREILVASSTAMRLTVRDVERALAVPRPVDALSPESVHRQIEALRAATDAEAPVHLLAHAAGHARAIDEWARRQLAGDAPALEGLLRLLNLFVAREASQIEPVVQMTNEQSPVTPEEVHAFRPVAGGSAREDVLATIRAAREWFETHEPSSPVAVLLKQAERMVGKRFSQVADSIPLDLLRKWELEEGEGASLGAPV